MSTMASEITGVSFTQRFVQAQIKNKLSKLHVAGLFRWFTSDQWIPRTKGQ